MDATPTPPNPSARDESLERATPLDDLRIREVRPLISPALLQDELPASLAVQRHVNAQREQASRILRGHDPRLLVVVGPCSIHDAREALDYADRLRGLAPALQDALLLVMRVYFEKPRTTVGWKGFLNDPHLDGSFRINEGLRRARELLLQINERGLAVGTEFLDLLSPQYFSDLISWGAIGARTSESPTHRQLASGLSCPVGFKNGTDGGVQVAVDALVACRSPHAFMGMTKMGVAAIFETAGNAEAHVILRGGAGGPNYAPEDVQAACAALTRAGLPPGVMVDCSHANAAKQHERQITVARELGERIAQGDRQLLGLMIESHLNAGRQELRPGQPLLPGVSITDACIGWDDTETLLRELAGHVRQGRPLAPQGNRSANITA